MPLNLRADDRVLLLHIPEREPLAALSRILIKGVVVATGSRTQVDAARAAMADFENVMFLEAEPHQIPWRDAYFTKIVVAPGLEPLSVSSAAELRRVLAPGGQIVSEAETA